MTQTGTVQVMIYVTERCEDTSEMLVYLIDND